MKTVTFFVLVLGVCALSTAFSIENKELEFEDGKEVGVHSRNRRDVPGKTELINDPVEEAFNFAEENQNLGLRNRRDVSAVNINRPKYVKRKQFHSKTRFESEVNYGNAHTKPLQKKPKKHFRKGKIQKNKRRVPHHKNHNKKRLGPIKHRSPGNKLNTEIESSVYNSAHKTPTKSGIQTSVHSKLTAESAKPHQQTVVVVPKNIRSGSHHNYRNRQAPIQHRSSGNKLNTEIESSVYNSAHKTPTTSGIQTSVQTKLTAESAKPSPQTLVVIPPNRGFSSNASKKSASHTKNENKPNDKTPNPSPTGH